MKQGWTFVTQTAEDAVKPPTPLTLKPPSVNKIEDKMQLFRQKTS